MDWDGTKWKKKVFVSCHWEMRSSRSWHKTHSSKSLTLSCTRYTQYIIILFCLLGNDLLTKYPEGEVWINSVLTRGDVNAVPHFPFFSIMEKNTSPLPSSKSVFSSKLWLLHNLTPSCAIVFKVLPNFWLGHPWFGTIFGLFLSDLLSIQVIHIRDSHFKNWN